MPEWEVEITMYRESVLKYNNGTKEQVLAAAKRDILQASTETPGLNGFIRSIAPKEEELTND